MRGFERSQVSTLVERLSEPVERIVTIFGPRQSGKTTIVRQAVAQVEHPHRYGAVDQSEQPAVLPSEFSEADARSRISPPDAEWLVRTWEERRQAVRSSGVTHVLVLDEVQKIPRWSEVVKGLWDADRAVGLPLHVVVLGSAPLLMQAGLKESLAGRFESIPVTHWSFTEMRDAFGLGCDEYVFYGGYPGAADLRRDYGRWRSYVTDALIEPHLERDLLDMTRIDKPALLKQLFELGCMYSGQELSYKKMRGQLDDAGHESTLARYLDLLGRSGLVTGLFKHSDKPLQRRSSSPKLMVLNTALMSAVMGDTYDVARPDRSHWGHVVESAVGSHLINTASSATAVRYWRDGDAEVDFVLRRGSRTVGVEVKSGRGRPRRSSLEAFERKFSASPSIVVSDADVPLYEFLSEPADHWLDSS